MQNYQRFWRSVVAVMVVVVGVMVAEMTPVAQAGNGNPNPGVLPSDSKPYGHSYGEWGAMWWQWALSIPVSENPLFDETGEFAGVGQSGPVFFLAGVFNVSGTAERTITVPRGKALFFPLLNTAADNVGVEPPLMVGDQTHMRKKISECGTREHMIPV